MVTPRERKTAWQRAKRAQAAIAAGRIPHQTGRPRKPGVVVRRSRAQQPLVIPPKHTGHALFDEARRLTGITRDERSKTLMRRDDAMRDDCLSEAVLAILEGRDPVEASRQFRNRELTWIYRTCSMLIEE